MAVSGVDLYCKKENNTDLRILGSFDVERNKIINCEFHHTLQNDLDKKDCLFVYFFLFIMGWNGLR